MRIHCLRHETFEDAANIVVWASDKGHSLANTLLYAGEALPDMNSFDFLLIMGGSMNVYELDKFPWLKEEKQFIREAVDAGKTVLGVCLGAQLIADVLGGKVTRNPEREIGWFPVRLTPDAGRSKFFSILPQVFPAFHWHGDTFSIPPGAVRMAESDGCVNQAFEFDSRVIGLQFHLETSVKSMELLMEHCAEEMQPGKYVRQVEEIVARKDMIPEIDKLMRKLLDAMEELHRGS